MGREQQSFSLGFLILLTIQTSWLPGVKMHDLSFKGQYKCSHKEEFFLYHFKGCLEPWAPHLAYGSVSCGDCTFGLCLQEVVHSQLQHPCECQKPQSVSPYPHP